MFAVNRLMPIVAFGRIQSMFILDLCDITKINVIFLHKTCFFSIILFWVITISLGNHDRESKKRPNTHLLTHGHPNTSFFLLVLSPVE